MDSWEKEGSGKDRGRTDWKELTEEEKGRQDRIPLQFRTSGGGRERSLWVCEGRGRTPPLPRSGTTPGSTPNPRRRHRLSCSL